MWLAQDDGAKWAKLPCQFLVHFHQFGDTFGFGVALATEATGAIPLVYIISLRESLSDIRKTHHWMQHKNNRPVGKNP